MEPSLAGLALVAGAVAAFNPCGFALLPAYLGLLSAAPDAGRASATRRAIRFATAMTVGFVAVFGLAGALLAPLVASLQRHLPVLTIVIGVVLVILGGWLAAGRGLAVPGLAGRGRPPGAGWASQLGFGVSFALASLSCTLAPFLAVTAGALRAEGPLGVVLTFVAYALGMGTVVLVLSLAVALARGTLVRRMRHAGAWISRGSGALLMVAGAYVAWYGWFEIRVLAGTALDDPVVSTAVAAQGAVSRWVGGLGAEGLLVLVVAAGALVAVLLHHSRRRTEEQVR